MRKERARLVPAAAVKPALQVVGNIIGLKVSVAGLVSSWLNLQLNCQSARNTTLLEGGKGLRYSRGSGEMR